jgi:hypothetical protein
MKEHDAIRLRHMLDAVREALTFMEGRTVEDLQRDRMFFLALVKEIEIIGEAAARISNEIRQALNPSDSTGLKFKHDRSASRTEVGPTPLLQRPLVSTADLRKAIDRQLP